MTEAYEPVRLLRPAGVPPDCRSVVALVAGRITGAGLPRTPHEIDPDKGVSEMEVTFERMPDGWDPRTIVLMCCDRALIMSARETPGTVGMFRAPGGLLSIGRDLPGNGRDSFMRTADGVTMAHVRATSHTDFASSRPRDESRIEGGISHLRRGVNGIKHIPSFDGMMMQAGPHLVVVTTRFAAELEDGSTIYGWTPSSKN